MSTEKDLGFSLVVRNFSLALEQNCKMYAIMCSALGKLENLSRMSFKEDRARKLQIPFLPETFQRLSCFWANTMLLNVAKECRHNDDSLNSSGVSTRVSRSAGLSRETT